MTNNYRRPNQYQLVDQSKGDDFNRRCTDWLWQALEDTELPPATIVVALVIILHLNRKAGAAWPSVAAIARLTKLSERHVQRMLRALEQRGHLAIEMRKTAADDNDTSIYKLLVLTPGGDSERIKRRLFVTRRGDTHVTQTSESELLKELAPAAPLADDERPAEGVTVPSSAIGGMLADLAQSLRVGPKRNPGVTADAPVQANISRVSDNG